MSTINTPKFRVSYPHVFKAAKNELSGKDEYSLVALFPQGADLKLLEKEVTDACVKKWGADTSKWPKPLRTPIRDQGERAKMKDGKEVLPDGHEKGAKFLNLKSTQRPAVVDENVQKIIDESQFYAGCFAIASVRAVAYDKAGNRGVSFYLNNVQKVGDGDPLGGRTSPEEDFAPIEGAGALNSSDGGSSASDLFT